MSDLHAAIRAELDDFCETDMCSEKGKAALLAVLELHGNYATDPCLKLDDGAAWDPALHEPCPTVLAIAEKLGIGT